MIYNHVVEKDKMRKQHKEELDVEKDIKTLYRTCTKLKKLETLKKFIDTLKDNEIEML